METLITSVHLDRPCSGRPGQPAGLSLVLSGHNDSRTGVFDGPEALLHSASLTAPGRTVNPAPYLSP